MIWPCLLNYVLMFRWELFADWFWICSGFVLLCVYSVCLCSDDEKGDEEERGGCIAARSEV